jgi:twitching motility two-component system response regulator PilG
MVVDDSSTIRRSAELFLTKAGFDVVLVEDGLDALIRINDEDPDLVFIDVIMPNVDGLEAVQIIKGNSKFKNTPIIFLSSKDSEFDKARGIMMGATDYLTKPFTKDGIVGIVNQYVKAK